MRSKKIIVSGIVQGVFFRKFTKEKAEELTLAGFVKNEPDGTVYLEIEGDEKDVNEMITWCRTGPQNAIVKDVKEYSQVVKHFINFNIR